MDTRVINHAKSYTNISSLSSNKTTDKLSVGSKCALLKNLETVDYQYTLIQTCRAKSVEKSGTKCWDPVAESEVLNLIDNLDHNQHGPLLDHITVLDLNVWFAEQNKQRRFERIIEVIEQIVPDFVCLQEVQSDFRAKLQLSDIISDTYYISNSDIESGGINSRNLHGTLILSKWPCEFIVYPFAVSTQARYLLVCQTILNGMQFIIGTTHLESRVPDVEQRKEEINEAMSILDMHQNVIMTGDFNFDPSGEEQMNILPNFIDIYTQLSSDHDLPNFTWTRQPRADGHGTCKGQPPRGRLDRMLLKSKKIETKSFDLIGRDAIEPFQGEEPMMVETDNKCRTMSDHYGLLGIFQLHE